MKDVKDYINLMYNSKTGEKRANTTEYVISLATITRYDWKNKEGTSGEECPVCKYWNIHWEKFSGKKFDEQPCSNEGCLDKTEGRKAEHGAHVVNPDDNEKKVWIAPLCAKCNNSNNTKPFDLRCGTILVRATKCEIGK
jgi:hypothetical protein